ncbi:MAG TPA: hypothetical protein VFY06_06605 [Verrucomicrobiae bacterium]|nr:hypothetical protein [Verrucomicrobiae bacterium]
MSTKSPECWAIDPQARGLRVEVSPEQELLLPFDQFAFAELTTAGREQRLQFNFATHQVSIHGQNLRRIENAMQRMELNFVARVSTNYQSVVTQGQPLILKIVVTEIAPLNKKSQPGAAGS